jgi:hypothetical protein
MAGGGAGIGAAPVEDGVAFATAGGGSLAALEERNRPPNNDGLGLAVSTVCTGVVLQPPVSQGQGIGPTAVVLPVG